MSTKNILTVDDEKDICELIEITLARMGFDSRSANNLQDALELLETETFDLCLTDMRLPDGSGIELVEHIQKHYSNIPVAVITAHGNMESAVKALKAGAFDFVSKPVDIQLLRNLVSSATQLTDDDDGSRMQEDITGTSPLIQRLKENIAKVARSQAPAYIIGESGAGKERVARMIHLQSARKDAPFVPINCGAIPSELMESEFFGHRKGSFTGATADKEGFFQSAHGGSLFLDEIADLPLNMQVKLLRAIQEKAVRPIGSQNEIQVDVRIISASHKDLDEEVLQGRFRKDLFYRINVIELLVPSLRNRPEDIPALAEDLIAAIASKLDITPPTISDSAMESLVQYRFPGNVRELENILERAIALNDDGIIHRDDLKLDEGKRPEVAEEAPVSLDLESNEKHTITQALEKTRWNKTAAAKLLGLSLRQLRYRIEKLKID